MNKSSKLNKSAYTQRKLRVVESTKWEYPLPKSKEYWEKFCDDAAKSLLRSKTETLKPPITTDVEENISIKVIHPKDSCPYHRFEKPVRVFDDYIQDYLTPQEDLKNSPNISVPAAEEGKHIKSKTVTFNVSNGTNAIEVLDELEVGPTHRENESSKLPKFNDVKNLERSCDNNAVTPTTRIPKLLTASLQPSFAKTVSESFDEDYTPPKAESKSNDEFPNVINKVSTLENESLEKPLDDEEHADAISHRHTTSSSNSTEEFNIGYPEFDDKLIKACTIKRKRKQRFSDSAKYLYRYAYKALRKNTKNKKLNFEVELDSSSSQSSTVVTDKAESDEENLTEKLSKLIEARKLMENTKYKRPRDNVVSSKSTLSSRTTSGPSPKFILPCEEEKPSSLDRIPKMIFPRKSRDRCFSCLHEPFKKPDDEPKTRYTRLEKIIRMDDKMGEKIDESDSTTISTPDLDDDTVELVNIWKSKGFAKGEILNEAASPKNKKKQTADEIGQSSLFMDAASRKFPNEIEVEKIDKSTAEPSPIADLSEDVELKKATFKTISMSSDRSKPSSSIGEQSSEEEDDEVFEFKMLDDPSNSSRNTAPCFLPVVFCPSLQPLRALKSKKPMTYRQMKDLSIPKENKARDDSDDETYKSDKSRPVTMEALNKQQAMKSPQLPISAPMRNLSAGIDEIAEKDESLAKTTSLIKVKSVAENLTLESAESRRKQEERSLRRGFSCSNLETLKDSSEGKFDPRKTLVQKLDSIADDVDPVESFKAAEGKLPLLNDEEVARVLEECLEENRTSSEILRSLCDEFLKRTTEISGDPMSDPRVDRCNRIVRKLVKLLVDSKRYLYPEKFPSDLAFSSSQSPLCNSRRLRKILGLQIYNNLAHLAGMERCYEKKAPIIVEEASSYHSARNLSFVGKSDTSFDDLMVHRASTPDIESGKVRDRDESKSTDLNPYSMFLRKKRCEVVTWRPLTDVDLKGYDPAATLGMRAKIITNKICEDFCNWVKGISGDEEIQIDEEVIKDMFEIDFSAEVCRTMRVLLKEVSMVSTDVALARQCPEAGELGMTQKHLLRDAEAESKPLKIRGFGTMLPRDLQFMPPKNQVQERWLQCKKVPVDLETMDVVWKDITHLETVKSFVEWLEERPEVPRPEALHPKKLYQEWLARKRQPEADMYTHLELELHQIECLKVGKNPDEVVT